MFDSKIETGAANYSITEMKPALATRVASFEPFCKGLRRFYALILLKLFDLLTGMLLLCYASSRPNDKNLGVTGRNGI